MSTLIMAVAGPVADKVFEPALREGGALVPLFGKLVGVGPGAGMALMIVVGGLGGIVAGLGGYLFRTVRDAEAILPDYDQKTPEP
jgi:hypothetical protein